MKEHIREAQKKKAYDPKKSVWVPNPSKDVGGYFEGISEEEIKYDTFSAGKKLSVTVNGEVICLEFALYAFSQNAHAKKWLFYDYIVDVSM